MLPISANMYNRKLWYAIKVIECFPMFRRKMIPIIILKHENQLNIDFDVTQVVKMFRIRINLPLRVSAPV